MTPVVLADNIELGQISFIAGAIGVIFMIAAVIRIIRSRRSKTRTSNREQAKANFGTENNPVSYSDPYSALGEPPTNPPDAPSAMEGTQPPPQSQPQTTPSPFRPAPALRPDANAREEAASDYEHFIWE